MCRYAYLRKTVVNTRNIVWRDRQYWSMAIDWTQQELAFSKTLEPSLVSSPEDWLFQWRTVYADLYTNQHKLGFKDIEKSVYVETLEHFLLFSKKFRAI